MNLASKIVAATFNHKDSVFTVEKAITSSGITTSAQNLTTPALGGKILVEKVVLATDSTGLAGATNFILRLTGETYGMNDPIEETVANLGASVTRATPHPAVTADTTNDANIITVTAAVPFVVDVGANVSYLGTSSAGTGAGKILVVLVCRRLASGAKFSAA